MRGFTLLELLLALSIFALVAAMAYGGLNNILHQVHETEQRADELKDLQQTMAVMEQDLSQAVDRPVRDDFGDSKPALLSAQLGQYRLILTRAGYENPALARRSALARVAYGLDDEQVLYRYVWPTLDRAQGSEPYKIALLHGVKDWQVEFMDAQDKWQQFWPQQTASMYGLPRAVKLELDTEQFGKIDRLFVLPGR